MIIKEFEHPLERSKSYNITLHYAEDLDAWEIAECFKNQYPGIKCVIVFAKITAIEGGLIFVGLNLRGRKNG